MLGQFSVTANKLAFKIIFCVFVFIGAVSGMDAVIDFSDAAIFAMALVNVVALYLLMPVVKRELQSYFARLESGQIRPAR